MCLEKNSFYLSTQKEITTSTPSSIVLSPNIQKNKNKKKERKFH